MTASRHPHAGRPADLDRQLPALILKVGQYPVHSGGLGVLRTLGRCGVPVYAITEPGLPPAAASRYLTGRFVWRFTGREGPESLIPELLAAAERIGGPSVLVAIDDEAAVLAAEHRAELAGHFLIPDVAPGLPRRLASKPGLYELCRAFGVPAPATITPGSMDEVAEFAATASFPVVVKNAEPWLRRRHPVVPGTTVIGSPGELLGVIRAASEDGRAGLTGAGPHLIVQEYLPAEHAQDWVVHLYRGAGQGRSVTLTGQKIRSWPLDAGVTACGHATANPRVCAQAERICAEIGYRGVGDLDWRLDLRDGQYKLVDFNPRPGNQFRLFETEDGVDVVRALHLDMSGRPVPQSREVFGKRLVVEHIDIPARLVGRLRELREPRAAAAHAGRTARDQRGAGRTEYAWLAADDPLPFLVMVPHALRAAVARAGTALWHWISRGRH